MAFNSRVLYRKAYNMLDKCSLKRVRKAAEEKVKRDRALPQSRTDAEAALLPGDGGSATWELIMKKHYRLHLDQVAFEIRYDFGYVFLDRCGQILVDIERTCEGWAAVDAKPTGGKLEWLDRSFNVNFDALHYNFVAGEAYKPQIDDIADEASKIWKIVSANLGLTNFIRIGCRFFYFLPTNSIEESEKLIVNSSLNIKFPESISTKYKTKARQVVVVLEENDMEYRIELSGIRRVSKIDPSRLIQDPRLLSSSQKKARMDLLKKISEYEADPMYAAQLDVDCFMFEPKNFSVKEYILDQNQIVTRDFFPILEELCPR